MGMRGRKSTVALSVIGPNGVETIRRPEPPADLPVEAAEEWRGIVNRLPADWFPHETHSMLAQYCRHIVSARQVAATIEQLNQAVSDAIQGGAPAADTILGSVKALDRLLKMQERESRCLASLATKMRLSQQTTYDKSKKKPQSAAKPWEEDD